MQSQPTAEEITPPVETAVEVPKAPESPESIP